jgi:hypothetical protein
VGRFGRTGVGIAIVLSLAAGSAGATLDSSDAPCRAAQLRLALGPGISEATGQHTLALRLVNRGHDCVLDGYPLVSVHDRSGAIPFTMRNGGDQMITNRRPRPVLVRTSASAVVLLNNYRCDLGGRRTASSVRLLLPKPQASRGTLVLKLSSTARTVSWCGYGDPGSTLTVSPFEPTIRAALGG